jgi:site-specific DNA recombinase
MTRAAGYARVSTAEQAEKGWNLGADRSRIEAEAAAKGWELVDLYDDGGRQGDDRDRPEFNRMLAEVDRYDVLIMRDLDRFSRKLSIYALAVDDLQEAGVTLYEFEGEQGLRDLRLDDENDRLLADIKAAVAQNEKAKIKRRVKQAKTARRKAGGAPGGKRPYGYRYQDGALVVDPIEAATVQRMFEMADAGASQRTIARTLNAEGIPASRGGRWAPSTVSRILGSPLYLGKLRHRVKAGMSEVKSPRTSDTSWELFDGKHDPIVDEDVWQRVNVSRATPERRAGGRPLKSGHLLTRGLLRCGSCGSAMIPVAGYRGRDEVYRCIGRRDHGPGFCSMPQLGRELIDSALLAELTSRYFDLDGTRERLRARIATEAPQAQAVLSEALSELSAAQSRIAKVVRGWQDEILDDDEYRRQRCELDAELEGAEAAVEQAERRLAQIEATGTTTDAEEALLRHLADLKMLVSGNIDRAPDLESLRTVIRQLFERVTLVRWSWDTADEIQAAGVDVRSVRKNGQMAEIANQLADPLASSGELFLIPLPRAGVVDWSDANPTIRRVLVPLEEDTSSCRMHSFSAEALFAPILVGGAA